MSLETIRALYHYNAWANHRTLEACAALTEKQFSQDLSTSFGSVRGTLVHILGGEWIWLERWQGRSPEALLPESEFPTLASMQERWVEIERGLAEFVAGLKPSDLDRVIEYRNLRGNRFGYPLMSMLHHLVNHGTYHRGQVTTLLRQLGAKPRATDLLRYYDALAGQPEE